MVASVFFMVTTVTVAVPAMMLVVVTMMMLVVMPMMAVIMTVVAMMQQRPQCKKCNRRTDNAVVMMGLGRHAGQRKYNCSTRCNQAQFVSCQVNHYYLPLYLVTPPI